jgi:ribosomal protein S18 acetylase RimI-like enzyme
MVGKNIRGNPLEGSVVYYYTFRCMRAQYHTPSGVHGHAYLHFTGDVVEIVDFEIDLGHRGLGHGRQFMERILHRAVEFGCKRAVLHVSPDNVNAWKLYTKMGFSPHEEEDHLELELKGDAK